MTTTLNFGDERLPDRFWRNVHPCPMSGCWLWSGGKKYYPSSDRRHDGHSPRRVTRELVTRLKAVVGKRYVNACSVDICCNPAHARIGMDHQDPRVVSDYLRSWRLNRHYGITVEDFDRMFAEQRGRCAICHRKFGTSHIKKPRVDHCHRTGKVRGLLCLKCNAGIGSLGDDLFVLANAAAYVFKHDGMPEPSVESEEGDT